MCAGLCTDTGHNNTNDKVAVSPFTITSGRSAVRDRALGTCCISGALSQILSHGASFHGCTFMPRVPHITRAFGGCLCKCEEITADLPSRRDFAAVHARWPEPRERTW
jgi:hypothetical protein